jgi:hypothetical protein
VRGNLLEEDIHRPFYPGLTEISIPGTFGRFPPSTKRWLASSIATVTIRTQEDAESLGEESRIPRQAI